MNIFTKLLSKIILSLSNNEEPDLFEIEILTSDRIIINKKQIIKFFHINNISLDNAIRLNIIPEGRKRKGRKELYWFLDEIIDNLEIIKNTKHYDYSKKYN